MKITIESTDTFIKFGEVQCRMWLGHDEKGQEVIAGVLAVGARTDGDLTEFNQDLQFKGIGGSPVPLARPQPR